MEQLFLNAIKNHHRPAGANTNFVAPNTNSRDTWTNAHNFYYRDGHVFAVVQGHKANEMIHGNFQNNMQRDVQYHSNGENAAYNYHVIPQNHHIEHLRQYCNVMGGDLWAPSSEAEYTDIMDNGVCSMDSTRQVYLNIHREGHLGCPSSDAGQLPWSYENEFGESVPTFYTCPSGLNNLGVHEVRDLQSRNFRSFLTTDPWFASTLSEGMCANPTLDQYVYGYFGCYALNPAMERFSRFTDSIDEDLTNHHHTGSFYQKDCVVASCNQFGESTWSLQSCNQNYDAVCRIRAFGCEKQAFTCKQDYTRSCGDRSVYNEDYLPWADAQTNALYGLLRNEYININTITSSRKNNILSRATIPVYRASLSRQIIAVPSNFDSARISEVLSWRNLNEFLDNSYAVERRLPGFNYPTCVCECHDGEGIQSWTTMNSLVNQLLSQDGQRDTDDFRDLQYRLDRNTVSNSIGDVANWACTDAPYDCYTGGFAAECAYAFDFQGNSVNYEASWRLRSSIVGSCINHCCDAYNPDVHVFSDIIDYQNNHFYGWRAGDEYVVQCDEDLHIDNQDESVNTFRYEITDLDVANLNCFKPVTCVNVEVYVPPSCPTNHLSVNHINAAMTSPVPELWIAQTQYTVTCNNGFHMETLGDSVTSITNTIEDIMIENDFCFFEYKCCRIHNYNDQTSSARTPAWMQNRQFAHHSWNFNSHLLKWNDDRSDRTNFQADGVWDAVNSAINLGNGIFNDPNDFISFGTSDAREFGFISAMRDAHTNFDLIDNVSNPFDNVDNFWYRDGHMFASVENVDVANSRYHNSNVDAMHSEVYVNNDNEYQVRKESHHLEHMRSYCNDMGGDLWMPSSEQEYADIMESSEGFCANKPDGEVYMNIHRNGYMGCPNNDDASYQSWFTTNNFGETIENNYACPQRYGQNTAFDINGDAFIRPSRNMDDLSESKGFHTTDSWYSDNMYEDGMCAQPNLAHYFYSNFGCLADNSNMRFHRFSNLEMDTMHQIRGNNFNNEFQPISDCVVAKCNKGIDGRWDGTTSWSMSQCNRQQPTGICRMRAFGCDEPSYNCKAGYSRSCGDRSVYTRSRNSWVNARVANAAISLANHMEDTIDNHVSLIPSATIPLYRAYQTHDVIMHDATHNQFEITAINFWADNNVALFNDEFYTSNPLRIEPRRDNELYPTCTCECSSEGTLNDWVEMRDLISNHNGLQIDTNRGLAHVLDNRFADSNIIGSSATWNCNDNLGCYDGSFEATCRMVNGYEASWMLDESVNVCSNSCCGPYSNNIHTHAEMFFSNPFLAALKNSYSWTAGDTYTIRCDAGHHIFGESDGQSGTPAVVHRDFEITEEMVRNNACFPTVRCVEIIIPEPRCEDYVDNHTNAFLVTPMQDEWNEGDQFTIRCSGNLRLEGQANDQNEITREITLEMIDASSCWPRVVCVPKVCNAYNDNIHTMASITVISDPFRWVAGDSYTIQCAANHYRQGFSQNVDSYDHFITDAQIENNNCFPTIICVERTCETYNANNNLNAQMVALPFTNELRDNDEWRIGDFYAFQCNEGYYIQGLAQTENYISYEVTAQQVNSKTCFTPMICAQRTCPIYNNDIHSNAVMSQGSFINVAQWTWNMQYTIQCASGYYVAGEEQNVVSYTHTITLDQVLNGNCFVPIVCRPKTCAGYDDEIHANAGMTAGFKDAFSYIVGDEYTISCSEGHYIAGRDHTLTSFTNTVTLGQIESNTCFPRVVCSEMLCNRFNVNRYTNAALSVSSRDDEAVNGVIDRNSWGWEDTYTVTCQDGYHIENQEWDVDFYTHTITLNNVINRNCFPEVRCVERSCEANNNGIHSNAALFVPNNHNGIWRTDDTYTVSCNPGYYLSGEANDVNIWQYRITREDVNNRSCFNKPVVCLPLRCEIYDADIHNNAVMSSNTREFDNWQVGDQYTITCDSGYHRDGRNHANFEFTYEINANDILVKDCFKPISCSENLCPAYNNNMHVNAFMVDYDVTDNRVWRAEDTYTIQCVDGYYVAGENQNIGSASFTISAEQAFNENCFPQVVCQRRTCSVYNDDMHSNANMFINNNNFNRENDQWTWGMDYTISCDVGYYVEDRDFGVISMDYNISLDDVVNGNCWRSVRCVERFCPVYTDEIHSNAALNNKDDIEADSWGVGDKVTIKCDDMYYIRGQLQTDNKVVYEISLPMVLSGNCWNTVVCVPRTCENYDDRIHTSANMVRDINDDLPEFNAWSTGDSYTIRCNNNHHIGASGDYNIFEYTYTIKDQDVLDRNCFNDIHCELNICEEYDPDMHVNAVMTSIPMSNHRNWQENVQYTISCDIGYHLEDAPHDNSAWTYSIQQEDVMNKDCFKPVRCVERRCPEYSDDIHENARMVAHEDNDDVWYKEESFIVRCDPGFRLQGRRNDEVEREFSLTLEDVTRQDCYPRVVCERKTCELYDDNMHIAASMQVKDTNVAPHLWRVDMEYTIQCDFGMHVAGFGYEVMHMDYKIEFDQVENQNCFAPVECRERQCPCIEKDHGYCFPANDEQEEDELFNTNDRMICKCDEGYVNIDSVNDLPYDIFTCNGGDWDLEHMGRCVPITCANAYPLHDRHHNIVGMPMQETAQYGQCVEYVCAEGYEPAQYDENDRPVNPRACCDFNSHEDRSDEYYPKFGMMGYFPHHWIQRQWSEESFTEEVRGKIIGTCKRKYLYFIFDSPHSLDFFIFTPI